MMGDFNTSKPVILKKSAILKLTVLTVTNYLAEVEI